MLPICLDNMSPTFWTADDKAAIIRLHEDISWPRSLDVVYHLRNRTALSKSQPGMLTSLDARLALICSGFRRMVVRVIHVRTSMPDILARCPVGMVIVLAS